MSSTTKPVISSIIVLASVLQLISSEPRLSSILFQLCILISLGFLMTGRPTFNRLASTASAPFFLAWIGIPSLRPFCAITTIIAFASTVVRPLYSVITAALSWSLGYCIVLFLGTSVHIAFFRLDPSRCCNCNIKRELEETPTVVKVHARSRDTDAAFAGAGQRPNDVYDSRTSSSEASYASTCTNETDVASSSIQDPADFSFSDPDSSPDSTWDSDATSATLLSDSDVCSIAARFNHALVKKRFCVGDPIFCTPETSCKYHGATETDTGTVNCEVATDSVLDLADTCPPLGDLLSPSFSSTSISAQSPDPSSMVLDVSSSCSSFGLSPLPTRASSNLSNVFSTSFIAVARATSGPSSAPASRRSSFSSTAPLFRRLSLFASSTSSDVSLASTSPSPSRPLSIYRPLMLLPSGHWSSPSSSLSLSDIFLDASELAAVDSPSLSSQTTLNSARSIPIHTSADLPTPAPFIPASLSAWHLAEGRPLADNSPSGPLRIFGIPAEELPAHSYRLSPGDFPAKDETYLCAALGLHEPAPAPRHGFWTTPGGPRRWHPSRAEWHGWLFPRRGEHKPTFVPEEIPAQAPYDEDELGYLWTRWGFWPTSV